MRATVLEGVILRSPAASLPLPRGAFRRRPGDDAAKRGWVSRRLLQRGHDLGRGACRSRPGQDLRPPLGDSAPVSWRRTRPPPRAGWSARITRPCRRRLTLPGVDFCRPGDTGRLEGRDADGDAGSSPPRGDPARACHRAVRRGARPGARAGGHRGNRPHEITGHQLLRHRAGPRPGQFTRDRAAPILGTGFPRADVDSDFLRARRHSTGHAGAPPRRQPGPATACYSWIRSPARSPCAASGRWACGPYRWTRSSARPSSGATSAGPSGPPRAGCVTSGSSWRSRTARAAIPPIEVYRIRGLHFVSDSHHPRLHRRRGRQRTVDAYVTEISHRTTQRPHDTDTPAPTRSLTTLNGSSAGPPARPLLAAQMKPAAGWRTTRRCRRRPFNISLTSGPAPS